MRPPYLLGRRDPWADGGVSVNVDIASGVIGMAVSGDWQRQLYRAAYDGFRKCLSEHPVALIIDLCDMQDDRAASAGLWMTASRYAESMDPPVQVVACVPPATPLAERLVRLGAPRFLPVFDTLPQARAALRKHLPLAERLRLTLMPNLHACAMTRNLVTAACTAWQLPELVQPGRLVAHELAANAVVHAATPFTVVLRRQGVGLHLMVHDRDPRLPRLIEVGPHRPGHGLHVVHAAADRWGSLPTATGKVVWATLRPEAGRSW